MLFYLTLSFTLSHNYWMITNTTAIVKGVPKSTQKDVIIYWRVFRSWQGWLLDKTICFDISLISVAELVAIILSGPKFSAFCHKNVVYLQKNYKKTKIFKHINKSDDNYNSNCRLKAQIVYKWICSLFFF